MMFDPKSFENSRPDGFSVLEVVAGLPDLDGPRRFVPLKLTHLTGGIAGPLADLRLTQTFGYSAQECDQVLEALYRFPLPGDAAVTGVTVRFGEVVLQAELKERASAEADYEAAKREGRQATLATRESPDVFTLQVAGLQPDQEVTVETSYVQLARYEGADWTLRIPLTTAPRYVRGEEGASRHAQGQPLASMRDPGHRFSLNLLLSNAEKLKSPTHALEISPGEERLRVRLQGGEVVPDRDCVLTWRAEQADQHPAMHVLLHDDRATNQVYFMALLAPPRARPASGLVSREAILLVDHSGSMGGAKWEAADWTVTRFLQGLTPQDTFALGLFHDTTQWFGPRPVTATPDAVAAGVKYLRKSKDSGGTNLGVALEQALSLQRTEGSRARHVLLVTDAAVSDSGRILRLASDEAHQAQRRRLSVICIDAAPNALLANELAERGGGVSRFLTSEPAQEDITTALDSLLEDWSAPVLTGLRLAVNRPKAEAVDRAVESQPQQGGSWIDIGDLPSGRAVWVAGRVPRGDSPDLSFRLTSEGGGEVAACRRDLEVVSVPRPALKALFGARKVLGLEFLTTGHFNQNEMRSQLVRLGYDPDSALIDPNAKPKLYGENVQQDAHAALRGLLARESLAYGLVSSETAFIAVRTEAGQKVEETVMIANARPAGWQDESEQLFGSAFGQKFHRYAMSAPAPAPPSQGGEITEYASYIGDSASAAKPGMIQQALNAIGGLLGVNEKAADTTFSTPTNPLTVSPRPSAGLSMLSESSPREAVAPAGPVFSGIPTFANGEAVLFDSTSAAVPFAVDGRLSRLEVAFPRGVPTSLDSELTLLLYVEDLAAPRVRVRLVDLMQQGGFRPLNILRTTGQVVRLVLVDPTGVWTNLAPELAVTIL
jgi:Ca-activated chloride channel family protein